MNKNKLQATESHISDSEFWDYRHDINETENFH